MDISTFELERFFARHEFTAPYTLTSSDCEPLSLAAALDLADDEGLALWDGLKLGYTEYAGSPILRREIAGLYEGIDPDLVHVAAPIESIFLAMNAMLEHGDHVVCTHPGYQALSELAVALGCDVDKWEPVEERVWKFDVDRLSELVRPTTRAIIVNFPHNPTGYLPPLDDFLAVIEIARECGAYLFSDEMYRYLEVDPSTRLPAACERYDRAVSLSGMSKAFSMPGIRIGWLVTKDTKLLEKIAYLHDYTTICSSAPSEVLALIGLRAWERIVADNLARLRRNLALLERFFSEHGDVFSCVKPIAGTVSFPRVFSGGGSGSFCRKVLEITGVLLVPSEIFGYGDEHFRLGFGREDMPTVLELLADYLNGRSRAG